MLPRLPIPKPCSCDTGGHDGSAGILGNSEFADVEGVLLCDSGGTEDEEDLFGVLVSTCLPFPLSPTAACFVYESAMECSMQHGQLAFEED